jgi:hypothetical protein
MSELPSGASWAAAMIWFRRVNIGGGQSQTGGRRALHQRTA